MKFKLPSLHFGLILFLLLFAVVGAFAACGGTNCKDPANASSAKCTAVNAVVTCGGSAVDSLVSEQLPSVEKDLGSAVQGDGSIDYNAAVPVLEDYATKFGMCFLTKVFDKLSSLHLAAAPGAPSSRATPAALKGTLEKFRATHYTGTKFDLASGSGSGS